MWLPHVTVAAICEKNGQFLVVEEHSDSLNRLVINQPAGHLEQNESLIEAVQREALEETCYPFTPTYLVGIYRSVSPSGRTYIRFTFAGEVGELDSTLQRDPDILACHWLSASDIQNHGSLRSELVISSLNDYLNGARYPLELIQT